ncbi:porin [Paraburkholderia sp.]|uniref:porin n=1 Tax=Paraburkholderia sp. TaxID=1926495 RepID=UPI003D6E8C4F
MISAIGLLSGVAHAQSMVTLAGVVDGGIRFTNTGAGSQYSMNSNGLFTSNRLDFVGKEDLGGGYNAHFQLESGFNLGNGALDNTSGMLFNRGAFVGVGGWFGSLDFGRQYTIAHDVVFDYDPFNFEYPGIIPLTPATDGTRFSNDAKYTGEFGPLRVRAENSFGGVAGDFNSGSARGVGAQYKWGWLNVGGAYIHRTVQAGTTTTYQPDNYYVMGAALTFGALRFAGGYMNENQDAGPPAADVRTLNYWGGATYDINPYLRVGVGVYITDLPNSSGKRSQELGSLVYSLSKATRLYAEVDYTKFGGSYVTSKTLNATGQPHQIAVSVGINHGF